MPLVVRNRRPQPASALAIASAARPVSLVPAVPVVRTVSAAPLVLDPNVVRTARVTRASAAKAIKERQHPLEAAAARPEVLLTESKYALSFKVPISILNPDIFTDVTAASAAERRAAPARLRTANAASAAPPPNATEQCASDQR